MKITDAGYLGNSSEKGKDDGIKKIYIQNKTKQNKTRKTEKQKALPQGGRGKSFHYRGRKFVKRPINIETSILAALE